MFKKIIIVTNENVSNEHLSTLELVKSIIGQFNINYNVVLSNKVKKQDFDLVDLVISIGGDGTFIRAAAYIKNQCILGINSEPNESEGALTNILYCNKKELQNILNGNYKIIQRKRAKVVRNNIALDELSLNEVYIGTNYQFHTSRYKIEFDGCSENQRSSGVLVVTGSGSNAWYKSCGGKPFSCNEQILRFLVREPYCGRLFNPKILSGEISKDKKLMFYSTREQDGIISIDSNKIYDFNNNDLVEIELSEFSLNVLAPND